MTVFVRWISRQCLHECFGSQQTPDKHTRLQITSTFTFQPSPDMHLKHQAQKTQQIAIIYASFQSSRWAKSSKCKAARTHYTGNDPNCGVWPVLYMTQITITTWLFVSVNKYNQFAQQLHKWYAPEVEHWRARAFLLCIPSPLICCWSKSITNFSHLVFIFFTMFNSASIFLHVFYPWCSHTWYKQNHADFDILWYLPG